ncbi:MAG: chemotaxis protein CheV [bacterium]|nr:MAG: chemotaxis protein CheV [bacterium]
MSESGVLLESGTNELEIIEFNVNQKNSNGSVNSGYYGINVAKVKEIIRCPGSFADVPRAHPAMSGVYNLRGRIIPIINLPKWLNKEHGDFECERVIITVFNKVYTGFMVHSVSRIHRVSWERVESPSGLMNHAEKECVTGLVKFDEKILMMLDFERIVCEINPEAMVSTVKVKKSKKRQGKTVFVAEDSTFMRKVMVDLLERAGYRVFTANNGIDAIEKLNRIAENAVQENISLNRYVNMVVTDVEMPGMDGLHLTTKIKAHDTLKNIPVAIFSSMVTAENKRKWSSLGADAFIGKPDINRLVQLVDSQIL